MQMFCNTFNFKCLVKEPTCFKSINSPSCIVCLCVCVSVCCMCDLILTNRSSCFQNTTVIETGLSD